METIQLTASGIVGRVLAGRSLDRELATAWRQQPDLTAHQRASIQDACFGTLRHLGRLDAVLEELLQKPLQQEELRQLLRVALYQLAETRLAPHAIVDHAVRACAELKLPAAKGLVNAVLRNYGRRRAAVDAAAARTDVGRYSYPQWWIDKLRAEYPRAYGRILDAANARPPFTLRVNRRHTTEAEYLQQLSDAGIAARQLAPAGVQLDDPLPVDRVPGFAAGVVSVQDAAAQRAALLMDLEPGQRVLDACAAPGGKTAHILELADVTLTALDVDAERLQRVEQNVTRIGARATQVCGDAAQPATWFDGQHYDRILADVPCTASGVVRRHPDIKWLRRPADVAGFAARQSAILDALWQTLGGGGKLLYSTCSIFQEENRLQVEGFLERHTDARRLSLPGLDQQAEHPGQLLPDEQHDGFFYALLQKI